MEGERAPFLERRKQEVKFEPIPERRLVAERRKPRRKKEKEVIPVELDQPALEEERREGLHPSFCHNFYRFRRKIFNLLGIFGGCSFDVYDKRDRLVLHSQQQPFRLREKFRVYPDKERKEEILKIGTSHILDLGATYTVTDPTTERPIGALQRKWFKSIFKDTWRILNPEGEEIGRLTEKSGWGAFLSRILPWPQEYVIEETGGRVVARTIQHFNPFVLKHDMLVTEEPTIDRRLLVASGLLLLGIEGRHRSHSSRRHD